MRNRVLAETAARLVCAAALFVFAPTGAAATGTVHEHSVELTASVTDDPPRITLQWQTDTNSAGYRIARKPLGSGTWIQVGQVDGSETTWTDSGITAGTAYEYQVTKSHRAGLKGYGYIASAIRRAPVESRGKVIFIVEKGLAAQLPTELARMQQDLVGDGWTVVRRDVAKTVSVPEVKEVIRSAYNEDRANTKSLYLFGNIPVAFSGKISPDLHDNDLGAWPADVYYADMDGAWTDTTVDHIQPSTSGRSNVPGDGRFDQNDPPGEIRLQMGRVDLSNLTCFANKTPARYEVDLARQYLAKDHKFRHGQFDVQRRGMIFDRAHRGMELEPQTCAAWRSFPAFFGRDQIKVLGQYEYFPTLNNESYMWSYVVSGGSFYGSDYIGTSDDWALNTPKVVFTSFLGSWFGQWDRESDFLRAPLGASGYTLASIYSGQPQWILHPMSVGEPIGFSAMLTQNNDPSGSYPPQINAGFGEVHIALMGDPTLRMHIVKPPTALSGAVTGSGVNLSWNASADPEVAGYYVYKASSAEGPFTRISGNNAVATRAFTDPAGNQSAVYMVRALKLERTPAGSYYNLSQGAFYPDSGAGAGVPLAPREVGISINQGAVALQWLSQSVNVDTFQIQRRALPDGAFATIAEVAGSELSYVDRNLSAGIYAYRVKALGFAGESPFSGEASVNLQPSWGNIIGTDSTTGGNWIGKYGDEGYLVVGAATNLPPYVTFDPRNTFTWVGSWDSTADPQTLLRPDGKSRIHAAWGNNHHTPMTLSFRFNDSAVHRVSIYMLDQPGFRSGFVDLVDPFTGKIFGSSYFTNLVAGKYITMDVRNYVDVRVRSEFEFSYNIFVNGIFFSTPPLSTNTQTSVSLGSADTATQGDWQAKYGSIGKMVANWTTGLPAEAEITVGGSRWTWNSTTTERRAVNKYASDNTRIASAFYDPNQLSIDVSIASTTPRQIALYFLDWDRVGRVQDMTIVDEAGGLILQDRIENFAEGKYVILHAKGKFRINLRRIAGNNAALAAIFLDPSTVVSTEPPRLDTSKINVTGGSYIMRIAGQPGQTVQILGSLDLRTWTNIGEVSLSGLSIDFTLPYNAQQPHRFYRAQLKQ